MSDITPYSQDPYQRGSSVIRSYAETLPEKPGVYRMISESDKVLYVGKAKNLRSRVLSYTRLTNLNNRIIRMVSQTSSMIFERTQTEAEALLLEADLIKALKPHFNVLLKDDKSYPYILIRTDHKAPQIIKHRGKKSIAGHYFGPFASGHYAYKILDILQKIFLLRTCEDSVFENRSRPCLLYQIKRCSAPCTQEISFENYNKDIATAIEFMTSGSKKIIQYLTTEMYQASDKMDFEQAALYRDRLKALSQLDISNDFHPQTFSNADVFALYRCNDMACIQVNFIRATQNWGGHSYFPRFSSDMSDSEILDGFLGQYYQNKPPAELILLSHPLERADLFIQAFTKRYDTHIQIETPSCGDKSETIKKVMITAQSELERKKLNHGTQIELLQELSALIGDPEIILNRIEVYDNAHISGQHAVGGMIVASPDGFIKKEYRTWKFKNPETKTNDDYAMMREVFHRRFVRLHEEISENPDKNPDLIILDGGQGQLSVVLEVAKQHGITIPIIAVAKGQDRHAGRERFFLPNQQSFILEPNHHILYYIQRLRDEAHRHANSAHGRSRDKVKSQNLLDDIPGIGNARKKALIAHFGSARAVSEASLEYLERTPTISKKMALDIFNFFQTSS